MVGPASAAQRLVAGFGIGVALSAVLALAEVWGGVTLAYWTDWPTSFWITALSGGVYFAGLALGPRLASHMGPRSASVIPAKAGIPTSFSPAGRRTG
jgi:zinc/manganese transport system permease protein